MSWSEAAVDAHVWGEAEDGVGVERDQLSVAVQRALARLTPEHRAILVLKEVEDMSYAEIARTMEIPAGTVASRLYHARLALRKVLLDRGISQEVV